MPAIIVSLGEILWDLLPDGKQLGGAPANFAYQIKNLGLDHVEPYIISSIGDDPLGQEIQTQLDKQQINKNFLHISHTHATGIVSITLDNQGIPCYTIEQDAAWDFIPEIRYNIQREIAIVYFGTLAQRSSQSRNSIHTFLSKLPSQTIKIFDINLRPPYFNLNIIEISLNYASVLKINDDELSQLAKLLKISGNEEKLVSTICQRYNIKLCILTKGKSGSFLYSDEHRSFHPGFIVHCVDSIGAGDAFSAAIALGILKGFDLDTMNSFANQIASFVCTKPGACPELPDELISLFK